MNIIIQIFGEITEMSRKLHFTMIIYGFLIDFCKQFFWLFTGLREEFTPDERVVLAGGRSDADPHHVERPHMVHLMVCFQETNP